jgi:small subunit ribosomal protein S1
MATLMDSMDFGQHQFGPGRVVPGTVLKITDKEVLVDIGYKSEGVVPLHEFRDASGAVRIQPGDQIEVLLEQMEDENGYVLASRDKAEKMKVWDKVEGAYRDNRTVVGRVIERVKGGLSVDIGVRAFLPGSQIDVRPVRDLESLRGKEFRMKVLKVNKKRGNIVLSRKAVVEEENASKKAETLKVLREGEQMKGVVKNITEYGAFIDLGGIDGLLHITDMSWGRVNHPSELFVVGDEVEVLVLKFDPENERVSLGHKQRSPDPWKAVPDKYPVHSKVKGKVVSLTDYGAFVELEQGVEGLIHVSEMSWNKRLKHPSKVLAVGDMVEAAVLDIDVGARRISLGLKQTEPNPWKVIKERYKPGDKVEGKVRNLTDFGAFVEIAEGIDGLIHVSDMSWTKKVRHPSEVLKKGDEVTAVILNIDADNQRLSLGLKQLQPNIWDQFFSDHHLGQVVEGTITKLTKFGAFVEISEGIEGLVHISEIDEGHIDNLEDRFKVGDKLTMKVIKMDPAEKKVGLSVKAFKMDQRQNELGQYIDYMNERKISFGDVVGDFPGRDAIGRREKKRGRRPKVEDDDYQDYRNYEDIDE